MPVLHEVIAVVSDGEEKLKKITEETIRVFTNNRELFTGTVVKVTAHDDKDSKALDKVERREITTSVRDRLEYSLKAAFEEANRSATIDATNNVAKAHIIVDGTTLAQDVPAVTLLGLERRFKNLQAVILAAPTRPSGISWKVADGYSANIKVTEHPKVTKVTKQVPSAFILAPATDKHQAVTEKIVTDTPVADREEVTYNGMLDPEEKAEMLERCGTLLDAIKAARMRANGQEIVKLEPMEALVKYVLG